MKWKDYQSNILPPLQNYKNDILPDDMNDEDFINYLKNFPVDEQIHKIIIDLIYEKPVSFEEANVLAQNV